MPPYLFITENMVVGDLCKGGSPTHPIKVALSKVFSSSRKGTLLTHFPWFIEPVERTFSVSVFSLSSLLPASSMFRLIPIPNRPILLDEESSGALTYTIFALKISTPAGSILSTNPVLVIPVKEDCP